MEFTLDFSTIRKIVSQEHALARAQIAELGPIESFGMSLDRHDQRLATAPDAATLACKAGCSWCCHFSIDVRPVEVLNILEFVSREFSASERQRIRREAEFNGTQLRPLDELARMQRNVKCPFLNDGRCTIYAVRPQACRNYHATDAEGCRRSFEQPDNLDIDPAYAPLVYQSGNAQVDAFAKAMREAVYDVDAYEMNLALTDALADSAGVRARFHAKQKVFDFEGLDVPLEFADCE